MEYAVGRALKNKVPILQKLAGYDRRLLVLLQVDYFAEPDRLREVLNEQDIKPIDAIFLIDLNQAMHLLVARVNLFRPLQVKKPE